MHRTFKTGEILFREDERSRNVFRVTAGHVAVVRATPSGGESVGLIGPGEFVGEIGVLVAARRTGTARCREETKVQILTRSDFLALIAHDAPLRMKLLHLLSLRTRVQVDLLDSRGESPPRGWTLEDLIRRLFRSNPFKGSLSTLPIEDFPRRVLAPGSVIFEEGQPSNQVFFVEYGCVRVVRRAGGREVRLGTVNRNEFLGEMGVLESMPRTGTAVAVGETVVRSLTPIQFFRLMERSLAAYFEVLSTLCTRASKLNRMVRGVRAEGLFEATCSIEGVAQLAEQRACDEARRIRGFFELQVEHGKYMADVYARYLRGEAGTEEMEQANVYFRDYLKVAGLGALVLLPGAPITIPLAVKLGKAVGVDIFPASAPEPRISSSASN